MVRNEYLRFLQTLKIDEVSPKVRKIANLILDHFEQILPLGTAQAKRTKKIVELVENNWDKSSNTIDDIANIADDTEDKIKQLKAITIGPFRGFVKKEILELNSLLVLIYGPNGTGKSSFCEALEYSLLGSVEEAQSRRFTNQQNYLRNAHTNKFSPPILEGINSTGETVSLTPNEALYRFCFVEKNRIDNFSRIAAHAPAKQNELISSLFGLNSFNNFVKKFSRELDKRYIDLVGKKGELLLKKQQSITVHKQTIKNDEKSLVTIGCKEEDLTSKYKKDMTFLQMVEELGSNDNPGKIQTLEAELQQKQLPSTGLTIKALTDSQTKIESIHKNLSAKLTELAKVSEGLSFKQLYSAVLDLQEASKENCPACKTPITKVIHNPYELATFELSKLGHLSQLEQDRNTLQLELSKTIGFVYKMVHTCIEHIDLDKEINPLRICLIEDEHQPDFSWWQHLEPGSEDLASNWWLLNDHVQKLEERDKGIKQANEERAEKQARLIELRKLKEEATKLQVKRSTIVESSQKAKKIIEEFDEKNKTLINDVETEKSVVATNQEIAESYRIFIDTLISYKEKLPSKLIADLGDLVVQLYNAFNRNDAPKDLLSSIKLPLVTGQQIEISYQTDPRKFFDALHILSEGHIRCLGLAILLAKNLKTNSPFLIFDDPVNAIDDEHRSAIRETLFKDEYFKQKQIILACHGNEFFKDTLQLVGKIVAQDSESYKFLPQTGENHVQVCSLKRPTNYVLAATELLGEAEYRDALMSSRRALEFLCEKVWFHYGKYCDSTDSLISVQRRNPNAPWDLRALTENLKSKMKKSKADIPNKAKIIGALENLLGVNGQDPHWVYLNKGTHEENNRDEFDYPVVKEIVESVEQLDEALSL